MICINDVYSDTIEANYLFPFIHKRHHSFTIVSNTNEWCLDLSILYYFDSQFVVNQTF